MAVSLPFAAVFAAEPEVCPLAIPGKPATKAGIYIKDLRTDEVLVDVNAGALFVPASVTKALTTAGVISTYPPDYRWVTSVHAKGYIKNSILYGNVDVRAVGDPTLESAHFKDYGGFADSIAAAVRAAGIDSITGTVTVTYTTSLEEEVPSGWMNEDLSYPYGTAHHALNYKDNKMSLNLSTGRTVPPTPSLDIVRVKGSGIRKKRDGNTLYVGSKAKGSMAVAMPDPSDAMRSEAISAIRKKGAGISYDAVPTDDTAESTLLYRHMSPPLSEVTKSLMFRSDNLMAEGVLRLMAPSDTRQGCTARGLSLWNARGVETEGIYVEDGSGLSRHDRISPKFLADVLEWMYLSRDGHRYLDLFPKAGLEGTMRNFMKGTPLEGRMAAKTGSMRGVQSFAGYILDERGEPSHIVVVMINGFTCDRATFKNAIGKYILETIKL
ncbi:MAG: D-alanyl-D-alanine carboxypeptidase/D-alanyl-D-alanine-endopeptidase [Muribaculaceae bacterium]|nr:D-alanyl-D-alanine carboxypeptidase/D-alanyl-D-alanine-endopeptidase [Muribaculaceae bacterium]